MKQLHWRHNFSLERAIKAYEESNKIFIFKHNKIYFGIDK